MAGEVPVEQVHRRGERQHPGPPEGLELRRGQFSAKENVEAARDPRLVRLLQDERTVDLQLG